MMDVDTVLAPSFLDSDDSEDAVNSSSAKVYFGPVLSPEKKLVLKLSQHRSVDLQDQLANHSSRPYSSILRTPPSIKQDKVICDSYGNSTPSTPIQLEKDKQVSALFGEGEPSSILASRILRAHDNPSPPPKPQGHHPHSSPDVFSSPPTISHEFQKHTVKLVTSRTDFVSVVTHEDDFASEAPLKSPSTLRQMPSQEDLISFDRPLVVPADDQEKHGSYDQGEIVEDLLSTSPIAHALPPVMLNVSYPNLETQLSTPPRRRGSPTFLDTSNTEFKEITYPEAVFPSSVSAMKRKRKLEDGDGELPTFQKKIAKTSITRLYSSPNGVSLSDLETLDIGDDNHSKRKAIRKDRKRLKVDQCTQKGPMIRPLSSNSSSLLSNTMTPVPTSQNCDSSGKVQGRSDYKKSTILRPDWNFSRTVLSSPQRPAIGTPYFAGNFVPQTPQSNTFTSPLKFGFGLNDPKRTPARRVPMAEFAVVSSTKNNQLLATNSDISAKSVVNRFDRTPSNRTPAFANTVSSSKVQDRLGNRSGSHSKESDKKGEGSSKITDTDKTELFTSLTSPNSKSRPIVKALDVPHKSNTNVFDSRIPRGTFSFRASSNAARSSGENESKLLLRSIHTSSAIPNKGSRPLINSEDENMKTSSGSRNTVQLKQRKHIFKSSPSRRSPIGGRKIPGAFNIPDRSLGISKTTSTGVRHRVSPLKKPGTPVKPIIPRAVIKGTLQDYEIRSAYFGGLQAVADAKAREKARESPKEQQRSKEMDDIAHNVDAHMEDATTIVAEGHSPLISSKVPEIIGIDHNIDQELPSPSSRSSQRTLKVTDIHKDTFPSQPLISRRRGDKIFNRAVDSKANLPVNALALKTLTNNNTTKNQQYHSELKVQIIRKLGSRPTSPTTKLRSISQKQREEQGKQRAERAKRRRGDDVIGDIDDSDLNIGGISNGYLKHPRASGDDEDYVTPPRQNMKSKRVKWDIGLTTAKYLNEIEPRLQGRHRDLDILQSSRKGCLVKKKMTIDSFGNIVDTDIPLNIIREQITVAKFVYDNDEDNVDDESEDHMKVTRSKTKKNRSV